LADSGKEKNLRVLECSMPKWPKGIRGRGRGGDHRHRVERHEN